MNPGKKLIHRLKDPGISYEERTLTMLAILGEFAMVLAAVFDLIGGENKVETLTLFVMIIVVPVITGISVHFKKIFLGSVIQVVDLVFVVLPVIFFFGGGPQGGGVFWIVFSYMFIGMLLAGWLRMLMIVCLTMLTVAEYLIWLIHPELIWPHTREMFCLDAVISVFLVGASIYTMFIYQKYIFQAESTRAQEETKRAEELNRSQNQFFSSMNHEIRTPINSILGLNEVILRQDDASDEIRRDAANIQGAGRMLLALVNDILDISKIESGKMDIVPVDYRVGDMISEIVNMIWFKATEKGLEFIVDIDPAIPAILYGDEVRIKQILINLLNNAVKYTSEGSVVFHMECEKEGDEKVYLTISVSDTGMGIKKESLPHLFDAFQRVDEAKNRYIEGTGLGLSIVKQLVDLMDGEIKVSSVYTVGSTFTVGLPQKVSTSETVGDIHIASMGNEVLKKTYKVAFQAPTARILIVDDNEMNLDVEKKLLADTGMTIDTAISGKDALVETLRNSYDVILMDHLMPQMDGIECFREIRRQPGGLNRQTPEIVLTANAGGENRELYNAVGFDGYLVKPVSGNQLTDILIKFLPEEKVIVQNIGDAVRENINTAAGYRKKIPVLITTSSVCDLPAPVIRELSLDVIPFSVITDDGVFHDNVDLTAGELIKYMTEKDHYVVSDPPSVEEYEQFFSEQIKKAHHIIHIAFTSGMSEEYQRALEAAKTFDNVTVYDSGYLSSAMGLMVMAACRMAGQNESVETILEELDSIQKRMHCSFAIASTEFMSRKGFISANLNRIMKSLEVRPSLKIKDNKFGIDRIYLGRRKKCYEQYIRRALKNVKTADRDILFVTYADLSEERLQWIEAEIKKRADFSHIVFQQASAAIASNCGPGTFGLLFMDKGKRKYHLSSFFTYDSASEATENLNGGEHVSGTSGSPDKVDETVSGAKTPDSAPGFKWKPDTDTSLSLDPAAGGNGKISESADGSRTPEWLGSLEGIDAEIAMKNSGSEEAFRSVLRIFYDSIASKSEELTRYYEEENWGDYTIKVHALKSSAKLIGAMELSGEAERLEAAGKAGEADYIREHHSMLMERYRRYQEILKQVFGEEEGEEEKHRKPVADPDLMESVYEVLEEAAKDMNCDMMEDTFQEMEEYTIPESEAECFKELKECVDRYDYDGVLSALSKRQK